MKAGIIPSEKVQLEAVKKNGSAIEYIIDGGITPSEAVQLEAVKQFGPSISFIMLGGDIPSEEVQLEAIKQWWTKTFYQSILDEMDNQTEWFHKEINKLKLIRGPMPTRKY